MREKDLKEKLIQQAVEALQQATPEQIYIATEFIRCIAKNNERA